MSLFRLKTCRPEGKMRGSCVLTLSVSVLGIKVEAVLPFSSVLFVHLLGPEQHLYAGGTRSESQRSGRLWSQTCVCGTEA